MIEVKEPDVCRMIEVKEPVHPGGRLYVLERMFSAYLPKRADEELKELEELKNKLAVFLNCIPAILDTAHVGLVFIDVMGSRMFHVYLLSEDVNLLIYVLYGRTSYGATGNTHPQGD
jgi:hypothetical protein